MDLKNYINLSSKDQNMFIYRTTSFPRLIELFETRKNSLSAPWTWDDPFENFILNADFNKDGQRVKFAVHNQCFGQSWSTKYESDAIWRIYSPDKSCVRIRTKINKLATSLSSANKNHITSAFIGKVEYFSEKRIIPEAKKLAKYIAGKTAKNLARALLFKRNAFEHEEEVRLIYFGGHRETNKKIYQYGVDPHNLIESVALDPRASDQLLDVYKYYLRNKMGFKGGIIRSKLYEPPKELLYELRT
jgi:hypothetical protein